MDITRIPVDIQKQLDQLDLDLKEGDITEQGWNKKRTALLKQVPQHSTFDTLPPPAMIEREKSAISESSRQLSAPNSRSHSRDNSVTSQRSNPKSDSQSRLAARDTNGDDDEEIGIRDTSPTMLISTEPNRRENSLINASTTLVSNSNMNASASAASKRAAMQKMTGTWKQSAKSPPKPSILPPLSKTKSIDVLPPPPVPSRPNPAKEQTARIPNNKSGSNLNLARVGIEFRSNSSLKNAESNDTLAETFSDSPAPPSRLQIPAGAVGGGAHEGISPLSEETVMPISSGRRTHPVSQQAENSGDVVDKYGTITKRLNGLMKNNRGSLLNLRKSTTAPATVSPSRLAAVDTVAESGFANKGVFVSEPFSKTLDSSLGTDLESFSTFIGVIRARAFKAPKLPVLTVVDSKGKEVSIIWEKLIGRAEHTAVLLLEKVSAASVVALVYRSVETIEFVTALIACVFAGVVAVPVITDFWDCRLQEMAKIFELAGVSVIMTTESTVKALNKEILRVHHTFGRELEWWITNDIGSTMPKKKSLQMPAIVDNTPVFVEYSRAITGDLVGIEIPHGTIKSQCMNMKLSHSIGVDDVVYTSMDCRSSFGIVQILFMSLYAGAKMVHAPSVLNDNNQSAWFLDIKKRGVTVAFTSEPRLNCSVDYIRTLPQEQMKKIWKADSMNLSALRYLFIHYSAPYVRPNSRSHHEAFKHLLQFKMTNKNVLIPMVTMREYGNIVLSMRSLFSDTLSGIELGADRKELSQNRVVVQHRGNMEKPLLNLGREIVRLNDCGSFPPDTTMAIVNPHTEVMCRSNEVGELWISSNQLRLKFKDDDNLSASMFEAKLEPRAGQNLEELADSLFLRSRCFGFHEEGRVYVIGAFGERIGDVGNRDDWVVHYTSDINKTVMEMFNQVETCCSYGVFLNDEELAVLVVETKQSQTQEEMQNMARFMLETVAIDNQLHLYSIIFCKKDTLVRDREGVVSIDIARRCYDIGLLDPIYVHLNIRNSSKRIFGNLSADDREGVADAAHSLAMKLAHVMSSDNISPQVSDGNLLGNIGQGFGAIDRATQKDLLSFENILDLLIWRSTSAPNDIACITLDNRGKELKSMTFKKMNEKVASLAYTLTKKHIKAGDAVLLIYPNCVDYTIAVLACLYVGAVAIPYPDNNGTMFEHDVPMLIAIIREMKISLILAHSSVEEALKTRSMQAEIKQKKAELELETSFPEVYNISKAPKQSKAAMKEEEIRLILKHMEEKLIFPLIHIKIVDETKFDCGYISHHTLIAQCVMMKEEFNLIQDKPLLACARQTSGLGFLNSCVLGIYVGCPTVYISQIDFATNAQIWFDALSKHGVKDSFATYSMLEFAMNAAAPETHYQLNNVSNLMILTDTRAPFIESAEIVLAPYKLSKNAISVAYAPHHHPLVSSRSYMQTDPTILWLSLTELRRQKLKFVEPDDIDAVCIHDAGRVLPCTTVAVVDLQGKFLCGSEQIGQIWISSPASVEAITHLSTKPGIAPTIDDFNLDLPPDGLGVVQAELSKSAFVNTGDVGFLLDSVVTSYNNGEPHPTTGKVLFVLGNKSELIEVEGKDKGMRKKFMYFPLDIEQSIEHAHPSIIPEGTIIFNSKASGGLVAAVEIADPDKNSLNALSVIVNAILDTHQLAVAMVVILHEKTLSRTKSKFRQRPGLQLAFEGGLLKYHSSFKV